MGLVLFQVEGPFEVGFEKGKSGRRILREHIKEFWNQPGADDLASRQGCYVFASKFGKSYSPLYVGKAGRAFSKECFQSHKLNHLYNALFDSPRCRLVLFFVVRPRRNKNEEKLCGLERFLIQTAVIANPKLQNKTYTRGPGWAISGMQRATPGRRPIHVSQFARMMKLADCKE